MVAADSSVTCPHFVFFPFMSHGHIVPFLRLARLVRQGRSVRATVVTTPENASAIQDALRDTDVSVVEIPFPKDIEGVPQGVENTANLPSMACLPKFFNATKLMQNDFENVIESLEPAVTCVISDLFLGWTQQSAEKKGIPRLVFFGTSCFSMVMYQILLRDRPHLGISSRDASFSVPDFPELKLTRNDFEPPYNDFEPEGPEVDFMAEQAFSMWRSNGLIVNSFSELEEKYGDYLSKRFGLESWCVGPLCLAKPPPMPQTKEKPYWIKWLDEKSIKGEQVLYVAFGTQADVDPGQLQEIARGLEKSKVNFLWILRWKADEIAQTFEDKFKGRGIIVKEFVDQVELLGHESVTGFLSHCGWNSVLESISASVPILAMPMMAEQHINARFLVDVFNIGIRVMARNRSVRGFVTSEEVENNVKELMEGEKGKEARNRVKKLSQKAHNAMKQGGSSWRALDRLVQDMCKVRALMRSKHGKG